LLTHGVYTIDLGVEAGRNPRVPYPFKKTILRVFLKALKRFPRKLVITYTGCGGTILICEILCQGALVIVKVPSATPSPSKKTV
jgi:hypothetical protein